MVREARAFFVVSISGYNTELRNWKSNRREKIMG